MNRNGNDIKLNTKKLLKQAKTMKKWELIEEAVFSHSQLLNEIKQKEPKASVIEHCKAQIAIIEQALNEMMHEADYNTKQACKEIYKEITGLFHFLYATHEPAAMQLYGIALPEKQEAVHDLPFPPSVNRRNLKTKKVMKRG